MDLGAIEEGIKGILGQSLPELKHQEFDLDKKQDEFESWDSFSHMEIISLVEDKFKISLEIDEVVELDSPRKIVEIVNSKLNQK